MEATIRKNEQKSVKRKRIKNLKKIIGLPGEKGQNTRTETEFLMRATSLKSLQIHRTLTQ